MNDGYRYVEIIGAETSGFELVRHLATKHRHASLAEWSERIARGGVTIDGVVAEAQAIVRAGQRVEWHRPAWEEPDAPLGFDVVHEDEHLVVVTKPRGLPTLPGGGFLKHTLLAQVTARWPDAAPMHRLGRDTTGLVLFARTTDARSRIQSAWRTREVQKRYRALGAGVATFDSLDIDAPIGPVPHAILGTLHAASPTGRKSLSHAHVVERRADATLFDVWIDTGRPHQIRIHLASIGHPLAGDPLYAPGGLPFEGTTAVPGDGGYLLHAAELRLEHPVTHEPLDLRAPPPPELRARGE